MFLTLVTLIGLPTLSLANSRNFCARSLSWQTEAGLASVTADPSLAFKNIQVQQMILDHLQKNLINSTRSEMLSTILRGVADEEAASCLGNWFVKFYMNRSEEAFECPSDVQSQVNRHFDEPTDEVSMDFKAFRELITKIRPKVSGEVERQMSVWIEEIKAALLAELKSRKAPAQVLKQVAKIRLDPVTCPHFSPTKRGRISMEEAHLVYTCQDFLWRKVSLPHVIWTLAHEIGHSLDICELNRYKTMSLDERPSKLNATFKKHPVGDWYAEAFQEIAETQDLKPLDSICDFRNLHEAFADVVAARLAPAVIERLLSESGVQSSELKSLAYHSVGTRICNPRGDVNPEKIPVHDRHPMGTTRMKYWLQKVSYAD